MEKVRFAREQATMLITLYGRALDSRSERPILGDRAAVAAVERIDYDFGALDIGPETVIAVAARARLIDTWASEFLTDHPDATVVHLGCGMDSRILRLDPPPTVTWYDIDYPEVIDLRRSTYPARDNYHLIGTSVTPATWLDAIPTDRPTLVVAEGLTMYLHPEPGGEMLREIVATFSGGQLICDTYTRPAIAMQHLNPVVRSSGATLHWGVDDPSEFEQYGLRVRSSLDATQWPTTPDRTRPATADASVTAVPPHPSDTGSDIRRTARIGRWDF